MPGGRLAPEPCGVGGRYLQQSVEAILESAGDVLVEVVVVDDGTQPPLVKPELQGLKWTEVVEEERYVGRAVSSKGAYSYIDYGVL